MTEDFLLFTGLTGSGLFSFSFDEVSVAFAAIGLIVSLACFIYSGWYFRQPGALRTARVLIAGFFITAAGSLFAGDWLTYLIFIEGTTLFTYGLISLTNQRVAQRYIITQLGAAGLIMIGIAGRLVETGSISIYTASDSYSLFFLLGLGIKTSLLGLHFWLPEAHSEASSPVCALLSGFAVKLGAYGLMREVTELNQTLIFIGAAMAVFGAIHCIASRDIKRILAYSTVSQLGLIIAAISAGKASHYIALLHIGAHAFFKTSLFLTAGFMERVNDSRDHEVFGRGISGYPLILFSLVVCAGLLVGLPLFGTFESKSMIKAVVETQSRYPATVWLLIVASIGTAGYVFKVATAIFRAGNPRASEISPATDIRVGGAILALLAIGILTGPLSGRFLTSSPGDYAEAFVLLAAGAIIVSVIKGLLPQQKLVDIDSLLNLVLAGLMQFAALLRSFHNGDLSRYLITIVFSGFMILLYMFSGTGS